MKTMGISKFKAHALRALDQVSRTKQPIVITKRGKPMAEVVPCRGSEGKPTPARLAVALVFEKDIVSPLGEDIWNACK